MSAKKRFFAVLIALVMIFTSLPITAMAASKAPSKPKSLSSSVTSSTVTLKWGKVKKASGYTVYKYDTKKKKYSKIGTAKKNTYTVKKLKSATSYVYAVKSYRTVKKKKYYSGYSAKHTTSTAPGKVTGVKSSGVGKTSFTVSWKAVTRASKYKIKYSSDSAFKSDVRSLTTTKKSAKLSSLTQGTTYYVRVYALRSANKKTYTSASSAVLSVKTTGTAPQNDSNSGSGSNSGTQPGNVNYDATKSTVNEAVSYQKVDGFGASAAWWAQKVGGWANADEYLKILYSKTEGIGLNIYRYNLGGGSNTATGTNGGIERGRAAETFLATDDDPTVINESSFDWSRDAKAQKALALAKKYAGDDLRVTLFAASPPSQITNNHQACSPYNRPDFDDYWASTFEKNPVAGKYTKKENLDEKNFPLYFDYLENIADHFVKQGYNITDVSPINEPNFFWAESDWRKAWGCGKDENGEPVWEWRYVDRYGNFISDKCNALIDQDAELSAKKIRSAAQEGCFYSPQTTKKLLKYIAEHADKSKSYRFSMYEGAAADVDVDDFGDYINIDSNCNGTGSFARYTTEIFKEQVNRDYYKSVSLHSYWAYRHTKEITNKYLNERFPGVSVTCTEYCQMNNDGSNNIVKQYPVIDENGNQPKDEWGNPAQYWDYKEAVKADSPNNNCGGIYAGVQVAREIYDDMTALNATEWNWWTAVAGGYFPDGLVYYDGPSYTEEQTFDSTAKPMTTTKRLWCVGNYSRYIRSGAKRVETKEAQKDILSSAYKNPDGSLVIVYINQTDNGKTVNVSANGYKTYAAYETSKSRNLELSQNGAYSLSTGITLPAQSVVTVVLK